MALVSFFLQQRSFTTQSRYILVSPRSWIMRPRSIPWGLLLNQDLTVQH